MESTRRFSNNWQWVIAIALLVVAVIPVRLSNSRAGFEFILTCTIVLLLAVFIYENVNKWVAGFLILALISHSLPIMIMTGNKINTMQSHLVLMMIVLGCLFYSIIVLKCSSYERILDAMCVVALLHLVAVLFCILAKLSRVGLMTNPNDAAALFGLCSIAFFRDKRWWFLFIPILGLLLVKSSGGALGMFAAGAAYGSIKGKIWPACLMVIAAIMFYKFIDHPTAGIRLDAWAKAIKQSSVNLWSLGFGLGRWKEVYPIFIKTGAMDNGWQRLHNTFVQNYIEMGLGSIVITAGFLIDAVRRATRKCALPLSALAAIIVMSNTNSMFRMNAINAMFAVSWMAILEIQLRGDRCLNSELI